MSSHPCHCPLEEGGGGTQDLWECPAFSSQGSSPRSRMLGGGAPTREGAVPQVLCRHGLRPQATVLCRLHFRLGTDWPRCVGDWVGVGGGGVPSGLKCCGGGPAVETCPKQMSRPATRVRSESGPCGSPARAGKGPSALTTCRPQEAGWGTARSLCSSLHPRLG